MIEGQDGLTWARWQRIAAATEAGGFAGLYRSDHWVTPKGPPREALELWSSLTWLASNTTRLEFGPLVTPLSFRNPAVTAWQAACVDDLSGGRLRLGLGAGWQEREHASFGFDLPPLAERFARFAEGIEVVTRLLRSDEPVTFEGEHFQLRDALLTPRPARAGGPPIVIGGKGPRRTLPLVAHYADEWNAVSMTVDRFAELNAHLNDLIAAEGRDPGSVRRTLMTTVVYGRDEAALARRLAGRDAAEMREQGRFVGTADQLREQLGSAGEAGLDGVMLRWEDFDDAEGLEELGHAIVPGT
jgi:F420-dependent oxidoreductase-like protein